MERRYDSGRISPSFAQTQEEFTLDDSDDDNNNDDEGVDPGVGSADTYQREREVGGEAYEMQERMGRSREDVNGWADGDTPSPRRDRRLSGSTVASFQLYTPDEESAVVRKFDRRLVLFVALLYMLSFVDRSST
jgi:hypothetical protein